MPCRIRRRIGRSAPARGPLTFGTVPSAARPDHSRMPCCDTLGCACLAPCCNWLRPTPIEAHCDYGMNQAALRCSAGARQSAPKG
jgi:hypothetical protein